MVLINNVFLVFFVRSSKGKKSPQLARISFNIEYRVREGRGRESVVKKFLDKVVILNENCFNIPEIK